MGDILAARHFFSLSSNRNKSTLPLHLLHVLSIVNAYGRDSGETMGQGEEGIYAAVIPQQGYE
jgi:hypothetical protein